MADIRLKDYFKDGYILVVDDNLNMRRTIKNLFHGSEIDNIIEAPEGVTALNILRETVSKQEDGRIELDHKDEAMQTLLDNQILKMRSKQVNTSKCLFILLDWNMPRLTGIDVAREIRADKDLRDIPILMVTAELELGQVSKAGEIGVNGYLVKPFDGVKMEETIRKIIVNRENPPEHVKVILKGKELMEKGEYQEALQVFESAKKLKDSARVRVLIGEVQEKTGNDDEAIKSYVSATEMNPSFLMAQNAAANLYIKRGEEKSALKHIEKSCELSPHNSSRQMLLGNIYLRSNDGKKADMVFQMAVKLDPIIASEIGEIFFKSGNGPKAEPYFREALRTNTGDKIHIHNRLGIILRGAGKWEEAINEYQKAVALDPEDEVIHYNMGKAYLQGGKKYEAMDSFQDAIRLNPQFNQAREELVKL
jgi:tetratricopeptide (TPR) repeat protein